MTVLHRVLPCEMAGVVFGSLGVVVLAKDLRAQEQMTTLKLALRRQFPFAVVWMVEVDVAVLAA